MKKLSKILVPMLVLATMLISACSGAAPTDTSGGSKVSASPVEFTGVIEAIDGNQWTVDGQVITVDPSILRDGIFNVGDTVKVEAEVQDDGSILVTRVEAPNANDNSNDANGNDNNSNDVNVNDDNSNNANVNDDNGSNVNSNDANVNDDNSNNANGNDDNSNNANVNDDNSNDTNSNDANSNGGGSSDDNGNGGSNDDNSNDDNGG